MRCFRLTVKDCTGAIKGIQYIKDLTPKEVAKIANDIEEKERVTVDVDVYRKVNFRRRKL
jgi:hypothetical protein